MPKDYAGLAFGPVFDLTWSETPMGHSITLSSEIAPHLLDEPPRPRMHFQRSHHRLLYIFKLAVYRQFVGTSEYEMHPWHEFGSLRPGSALAGELIH
jgi:hypothetical protein